RRAGERAARADRRRARYGSARWPTPPRHACDDGGVMTEFTPGTRRVTLDELRERRHEILEIAGRHGASNIRVFGSVARGDADERSDVDFVVDLEQGRSLFDLGALLMDLQDALGCEVDVV